jgi:hypothetical protein
MAYVRSIRVRRGVAVAASLVFATAVTAGCHSGSTAKSTGSGTTSAGASPSASPSLVRASPDAFRQALAAVDTTVTPAFTRLTTADTPDKLQTAFGDAATQIGAAYSAFQAITPPQGADAAARQLATALTDLEKDLQSLSGDAKGDKLCTAASAVPRTSNLDSAKEIRDAASALAALDPTYKVGGFVPAAQPEPNRQGTNGGLGKGQRGGLGELTIKNEQGSDDAVIKLTDGTTVVREIYVRGGAEVKADGIPDGDLTAFYTTGKDWDGDAGKFTRDCGFQKFDDKLDFTTTSTNYTTFELTLYTVTGGNATTSQVPPDEFPSS